MNSFDTIRTHLQHVPEPHSHEHSIHHFASIRSAVVFATIQTVLGLSCILFTSKIHAFFPIVLGIFMFLFGLRDNICGIIVKEYQRPETTLTSQGIVIMVLGIVILSHYRNADQIIGAIWGVIGLGKGSEALNVAIYQYTIHKPFIGKAIHGAIEILLGIILLLDPLSAVEHHLFILGIELIVRSSQIVMDTKKQFS